MLDRSPNHAPMDVNSDALGCVISGYSCRLPGAPSASDFWALLSAGRAAIGEIGPERFAAARYASADLQEAGTSYTFRAGLIDDLWAFDPGFFGLSPREAKQMDPQQRLLLQVAWEAVEHAGLRLSQLKAGRTGVYVGASASDYSTQFYGDPARVDAPFMLGNTLSILSNRLSYVFDLTGPTYTVDTACSSSFYALDQAHRALLQGEIDTAIVGSVNVLLSPISFIGFSRAGMLSPNGRCAFLDAAADGYVRAEGAVAFVLRREDAAVENGDPVRGHLLATGINADGRTTGLALPSAARQAALMERLRDEAGLAPDDVAFAEAHGTGTRAGDLAEATSLGQIYGQGRAAPLPVGSAKTNVGHLEPASGLVGLLKAQMALEQGVLPPSLHIAEPNPEIDLETLNLAPATVPVTLPDRADPNAAVINSFGFGGANAHAILGASTSAASGFAEVSASKNLAHKGQASDANAPLILSAATADALKALADKWAPRLMQADAETGARLINHAAWRRERMAHSLVASGESSAEIGAALAQHLSGNSAPAVVTGSRTSTGRTTFVFSGNGSQWFGMGRHLFENDPQFRSGVSKTSEMFKAEGGLDISALLIDPELESKLNRASVGQSLLFTIQTALVQCLASRGVEPDAVAGHSVGEVAAAWCAGALSLQDAVRLIQARASLLETLHGTGGMAAVLSGVDALEEALDAFAEEEPELGSITLAADNNPRSTTISGAVETIDAFAKFARARRLAVKRLDVPYPYHSALVEPVREGLMRRIEGIEPRPTKVDFVSSTTGEAMLGELLGPEFWWMNTRAPVRFRQAVGALTDAGCRVFVELGPRPVLQNYVTESAKDLGVSIQYAPTLEQGRHQNRNLSQIAARAIAMGARHNELQVFGAPVPLQPDMDLPAYPWQQSQFRAEPTGVSVDVYGAGADDHPLLGWAEHPGSGVWHNHISVARQPWLADHNVGGVTVFPASGYAELVLAVGASEYGRQGGPVPALDLSGLDILQPLLIDKTHTLRTTLARETGTVTIESSPYPENGTWSLHARARVRPLPEDSNADRHYRGDADSSSTTPEAENSTGFLVDAERLYESAALLGLEYGPMFRCFAAGEVSGRAMTLELLVPGDGLEGLAGGFLLHPGCLDGAMHGLAALIAIETGNEEFVADPGATASEGQAFLPVRMGRLAVHQPGEAPVRGRLRLERFGVRSVTASLVLYGADGNTIASLTGLGLRAMPTARRKPLRARFWRQVIEQRSGAEPLVALPKDWAEPAARLKKLGLLARRQKSAGAGGLLIDAAARRLSWDVVANLAGPTRRLDATVLNGIDATAYPLFGRMLLALEEDALFAREVEDDAPPMTGTLAEGCDYPEFDELLRGLWDEAPELSGDLNALAGLADVLQDRLQDGLLESNALPRVQDRLQRRLQHGRWKVFETAFADLAESWSSGQRLTVLLIGVPPRDLLERILDHANLTRLTLTDPDDGLVELMDRDLQRHPALDVVPWEALVAGGHERDLVMVADRFSGMTTAGLAGLSRLLDAGGLMLGLHSSPSLAGDLIDGQQAGWWAATGDVSSNAPVGRRVAGPELAAALTQAGFSDVNISAADLSDPEVLVVSGIGSRSQKSARPAVSGSEETSPARTIFHRQSKGPSNASALGAALGTLEPEAEEPQLLALAPLISVPPVPWEGIVLLHPSSSEEAGSAATEIAEGIGEIQGLLDRLPAPDRLWIVIPGGCPGTAANTGQSASMAGLWGYGRTLINEYPDLEIRLVDPGLAPTDQPGRDDWAMRLAEIIASPGDEREILVNPTGLAVPRIEPVCSMEEPVGLGLPDTTLKLVAARVGGLDDLNWEPASRRPPEEGEVEIAIHATGLNFRDVMWAQGLLPEEALQHGFAGPALGMECAGVVVRAGQGSGFSEGERVAAFASGAFASHVTTPATTVMRIPEHLTFEAAASLPVVFATAHYALAELARVGPGDRVLLHGGAGGVGLAALQIARSKGARVFATAGTPAKRRILVAFGAEAVFDSRNLSFADQVLAASDGGVDVVLNALAGEAMERTIGCLRPFGRFIELGKRDFFADTKIGLYPFHRNLSYFGVDLDELLAARPHEAGRLIDAFSTAMEAGQVKPLPHQTFQAGDATLAFRLMQQAGHVGKIVIKPPRASGQAPHIQDFSTTTNVRGGWLVVGGTQGFGLATAKALAARGAEKLWLASRSGRPNEAGANEIAGLISQGISVEFLAMDVADADAVDAAFAGIAEDRVPLRGVVHSAMVLRDRPARELSEDDVMAVLAPKVAGAENLDRATRGQALDHFILYSSAVTLFGNLHQAPYVAANMALERIAAARRADGEVALAIGWGAIGDSGYLTRDQAARGLLDRLLDGAFISEEEALVGLSRWQQQDAGVDPDEAAVSFARLPWTRLAGDLPILSTPLFDRLDEPHAVETGVGDAAALRAELASLPPREALKMITAVLVTETATVLHQPEDEVDPRRPLGEIGFDSLMAVELRLGLEDKIGVSLPMLSLADATTLTDVAVKVLQTIRNGGLESEHEEGSALDELVSQHAAPGEGLETDEKADLRARAKNVKSLS